MTKGQYILFMVLVTALAVLSAAYGSGPSMNIYEFFGWATR